MNLWILYYKGRVIFGKSRVHALARTAALLTEGFWGFPQLLQANAGRILKSEYQRFILHPLQLITF